MIKIEILLRHVVFLFSHIILSSGNNLLIVLSKPQPLLTTAFFNHSPVESCLCYKRI